MNNMVNPTIPSSLRVLHVIDSGGLYGAENVLLDLMSEQVKMGLKTVLASIGEKHIKEKPIEHEAVRRGLTVKKFRMRPGLNFAGALQILHYAQKEGFDLLHSHGYKGNILLGLITRKIRKIPLITTLHGWTNTGSFTRMALYERMDSFCLRFTDAVILVNKAMLSHPRLKDRKRLNTVVINNGIPSASNDSTLKKIQQILSNRRFDRTIVDFCKEGYTIGSIGRLSKEKGYRYLIEALNLLIQKGMDANLIIMGEGEERQHLEGLSEKLGLSDRVLMPGYCTNARDYLTCLNVFVLPSLTEGMPITILEAMQAKVPIVATCVGGVPDVLEKEKDALLIESRNSEELANAIKRLYCNDALKYDLVTSAYTKVINNYTIAEMTKKYLKVYQSVYKTNE